MTDSKCPRYRVAYMVLEEWPDGHRSLSENRGGLEVFLTEVEAQARANELNREAGAGWHSS